MTTKELTEEIKTINDKLDLLLNRIESQEHCLKGYGNLINKAERDIDMLKRWRG